MCMNERQAQIRDAVLRVLTREWQGVIVIARASGVAWVFDVSDALEAMVLRGEIERTPLSARHTAYRLHTSTRGA